MTEEEKLQLREKMEAKLNELETSIEELKEASKPQGLDNAVGRLSRMDYINNKAISESQIIKAESELNGLNRWLSLYDIAKFGKCSRCGNEININRLLLMPSSSRCIKCANI
jgi:DnaK suppressor protein